MINQNKTHNPQAIRLVNVCKKYTIRHEKPTLVEKFFKGEKETFYALKHISLTIGTGEKVGIVGRNGSGKTTLLKIMTGIASQTSGTVKTHGKIVSIIDLWAGFHDDLTGEQNIYLNSMLLGVKKKDIDAKVQEIISYAEVGQFIDAPLFTHSSGMRLRLGFSVAIFANPDILIIDEGINVGDEYFRRKVRRTLRTKLWQNKTLILSTHNLEIIKQQCTRVIVMDQGAIIHDGGLEGLKFYDKLIS